MTVFIPKENNYFPVNKIFLLIILIAVNICIYIATQSQSSRWIGTVEIPSHHWFVNTNQFMNTLDSNATYFSLKDRLTEGKSIHFHYDFERIGDNKILVINEKMQTKIRRNRSYYLDDQCSLMFSGRDKMTVYNVALKCKY